MTVPVAIRVLGLTDTPLAVSAGDGQRFCDPIAPLLPVWGALSLSFPGIGTAVAALPGTAVGQIRSGLPEDPTRILLGLREIQADGRTLQGWVVHDANADYAMPEAFDDAWQQEDGDDALACASSGARGSLMLWPQS
jgi:hypothetical protein